MISLFYDCFQVVDICGLQLYLAQDVTELILFHEELVWGILNTISGQKLAQILRRLFDRATRVTELKRVILIWDLCVYTREFVHFQLNSVCIAKRSRCDPRQIK
mmetsp:Transcript_9714/g.24682  ORF Transcript_9714/g.24682 Transcript_9714/m.24682 type:complete len:104 (+) Transcript_9714:331-642(+)